MKKYISSAFAVLFCLLAVSCGKNETPESEISQLAVEVKNALDLYEIPKSESVFLELAVVPNPVSPENYTVSLDANSGLVSVYNAANGTSYQMLPSDAYQFTSTDVMLPRYSAKSTSCELKLKGAGCEVGTTYLLPVSIAAVQGGVNFKAPDEKAAYILFKMVESELSGSGTQSDPYIINDAKAFMKINGMLLDDSSVYFKMEQDIDFKDVVFTEDNPWTPINYAATDEDLAKAAKRKIYFDGKNHKISNFNGGGALFGNLVGCVQDLTIENADILCLVGNAGGVLAGNAGSAATENEVVVKNVVVKNSKLENDYKRTGGLIGWLQGGIVENSSSVDCEIIGSQQVGGLIGRADPGKIYNCSAKGTVTVNPYYGGGLVGVLVDGEVKNSYASVEVTQEGNNYTRSGGFIGQVDGQAVVEKCYATGDVYGTGHYAGGLIGVVGTDNANLTVSKCYSTGNLYLPTSGNFGHVGGILGSVATASTAAIDNCYASGSITGRRYSSGFVGTAFAAGAKLTVTNSYTTSDLSGIKLQDLCGVAIGNVVDGATVSYTGFIAWNDSGILFGYPAASAPLGGNYLGKEGTVSQKAQSFGWSSEIWDFSGDFPVLK